MSPAELAALARRVAEEAADLVRQRRAGEVTVAATKSSDVDVVTEADQASERLIRQRLAEARPDDGFLGEEGHDDAGSSGVRWVVDPIDGTVNFLYGLPNYAVSIAAEVDGEVVAGVVRNAATGVEYAAHIGDEGAVSLRDGEPITVRGPAPLGHRLIGTGFSYDPATRGRQGESVTRLLPMVRDVRRFGSCALDLCHVAEGLLDGYVEEGVNPWDHAAGGLIARAAGARLEVMRGSSGGTLVVCGPDHGFEEFLGAVRQAGFTAPVR